MREGRERESDIDALTALRKAVRSRNIRRARELASDALGRDRKPPELFKYVGLLALLEDDFTRAAENLRRAQRLLPRDAETLNGLGFLSLRRGRCDEAVDYWLQTLALRPNDPASAYFLRKVKQSKDLEHLAATCPPTGLFRSGPAFPAFPSFRGLPPLPRISLTPKTLIILGVIILLIPISYQAIRFFTRPGKMPIRPAMSSLKLPDGEKLVVTDSASRFTFQPEDLRGLLRSAKKDLRRRNHNALIITVNQVLHSNATEQVKERFRLILDYLPDPAAADEIRTRVNPAEYFNNPELYEGTWLVADGKVSRFESSDGITSFLLRTPEYANKSDGPWTYKVRTTARFDGLKDGSDVRLLGRFQNVVPLRGYILAEGVRLWFQKTEFLEVPAGK
jgi:tetratricopeptide (TPR) repeat protein